MKVPFFCSFSAFLLVISLGAQAQIDSAAKTHRIAVFVPLYLDSAFDATGNAKGQPTDQQGTPLNVDGLWALVFGNSTNNAAKTSLYFTAGPNMESEGIFGQFDATK